MQTLLNRLGRSGAAAFMAFALAATAHAAVSFAGLPALTVAAPVAAAQA